MRYKGVKILDEKGFSLIEILIAITVFAIGILALGKMQITSIKGNSFGNELTRAITLTQNKAEELTGLPYDDPLTKDTNDNGIGGLDDTQSGNNVIADGNQVNGRYNISWNIANDYPINNTKTIRVIVTWSIRGNLKNTSITSMKADII